MTRLLSFVSFSTVPRHERSNWLAFLLAFASICNLGAAYIQFGKTHYVSAAILFTAGTVAFVGAWRVHEQVKEDDELRQLEEGLVGVKVESKAEKIAEGMDEKLVISVSEATLRRSLG